MRLYGIISVVLLASLTSCGNKGGQATEEVPADSVLTDSLRNDSLQAIVEDYPMPKAADELFDDFVYNFVVNRKLQMERTRFPLPCEKDGKTVQLTKEQWKPERFFMRQGYYTLLFNDDKQMQLMKDTAVSEAVVEKILLSKNQVKNYVFQRIKGAWLLLEIRVTPLQADANSSFLSFYRRFVTDSAFQVKSLSETVDFVGPDPDDDFNMMEGVITPDTWEAFAPTLPHKTLYNIIYGKPQPEGKQKIYLLRGVANGLEMELRFRKEGGKWLLKKLMT